MLSFKEYQLSAERLIRYFHRGYWKNDEDALASMMYFMMVADQKFDQGYGDGCGSRDGFRVQYAEYGLLDYARSRRRNRLNKAADITNEVKQSVEEDDNPYTSVDARDFIEINLARLNPVQQNCIRLYYLSGFTMEEIGSTLNISTSCVSQQIQKSLEILRKRNGRTAEKETA